MNNQDNYQRCFCLTYKEVFISRRTQTCDIFVESLEEAKEKAKLHINNLNNIYGREFYEIDHISGPIGKVPQHLK